MAASVVRCCFKRVLAQSPSHIFSRTVQHPAVLPCFTNLLFSSRNYAAKSAKKARKFSEKKIRASEPEENDNRYKLPLPSEPKDDVYLTWCYQRPVYAANEALDLLKKFQQLDFTSPTQYLYADITLDMALEKKKTVGPFIGAIVLPYPFRDDINKILVFTEKEESATLAIEHGAALAGGTELIKPILNGEIQADFYLAVPQMSSRIVPLRTFLKLNYPTIRNGTVSQNIAEMIDFFKTCHRYSVTNGNLIQTPFAMLDMPNDQILANLDTVIKDICKNKPLKYGPFVTSLSFRSSTSEAVDVKVEQFLPEGALRKEVEEMEDDSEEAKQESR